MYEDEEKIIYTVKILTNLYKEMRSLTVVILILFVSRFIRGYTEESSDVAWEEWKRNFNKDYASDEEEEERRIVWERRVMQINEFNTRNESFKQSVNQFADIVSNKYGHH